MARFDEKTGERLDSPEPVQKQDQPAKPAEKPQAPAAAQQPSRDRGARR